MLHWKTQTSYKDYLKNSLNRSKNPNVTNNINVLVGGWIPNNMGLFFFKLCAVNGHAAKGVHGFKSFLSFYSLFLIISPTQSNVSRVH